MSIILRPGTAADAHACGTICYEAFKAIAVAHNFPPDFPSPEVASGLLSILLTHPHFYSVVAEVEGGVVGSNFLDERSRIAGVGPITVDPTGQNRGVGGQLMQDVLDRAARQQASGVRLLQSGFHNRSLCLYTKLGFRTREPVSVLQGKPLRAKISGLRSSSSDGRRRGRLRQGLPSGPWVRSRLRITRRGQPERRIGRRTSRAYHRLHDRDCFFGHSVAETNQDLMALIGAAPEFGGPGFLLPTRNHEVFKWCLEAGLKLASQMTLMTMGLYNEPTGPYLPSALY